MTKTCPAITRTIVGAPSPVTFQDSAEQLSIAIRHVGATTADRLFELTNYWFVERKDFAAALAVLERVSLVACEAGKVSWIGPGERSG